MRVLFAVLVHLAVSRAAEIAAPSAAPAAQPPRLWETPEYLSCITGKPPSQAPSGVGAGARARAGETPVAPKKNLFVKADPLNLPSAHPEGDFDALKESLKRRIEHCKNQNAQAQTQAQAQFGERTLTLQQYCVDVSERMLVLAKTAASMGDFIEKIKWGFDWYEKVDADGKESNVLFTGYNAPSFNGKMMRAGEECRWPLYRKPDDWTQVQENGKKVSRRKDPQSGAITPYYDRAAINNGALNGRGLEIACLASPLDVDQIQVEGSGAVRFVDDNGTPQTLHLNYDEANGHPNVMLAKHMRCMGLKAKYWSSGAGIRAYFKEHPEHLLDFVNLNKSYVFFKADNKPATGALGLALTPRHSLAVDKKLIPLGAAVLFSTNRPAPPAQGKAPDIKFTSIGLAEDVGGAIQGNHVDVFWGDDDYSNHAASVMGGRGRIFVAVPKAAP